MNDYIILKNLFQNQQDEMTFKLFKEVNIIKLNNNNNNAYTNNQIQFNTRPLASKIINYSNAFIEVEIELEVPYDDTDAGKKSVPKLIALKNSYEIVKNLKIQLNNTIISDESDINRSNLINYILNSANNSSTTYRNVSKATSTTLNISSNKFITDENYYTKQDYHTEADEQNHFITFKIPIFLKDISEFFRKLDIIQFAEFTIYISLIDNIFASSRQDIIYEIKSAYLFTEEIKLTDSDNKKYLRMLNNNFIKKINFLESHTITYNDKLNLINNDFALTSIRNSDSAFIYGISKVRQINLNHDLPNIEFKTCYLNIDNIKFENGVQNDVCAYNTLKYKSNYSNNFLLTYNEFKNYHRIYLFNVNRETQGDNNNKFMNIITELNDTNCVIYVVWRNCASISLEYNDSGLTIYKTY